MRTSSTCPAISRFSCTRCSSAGRTTWAACWKPFPAPTRRWRAPSRSACRIVSGSATRISAVARTSLRQLWRMYFQYGYFKPLVARKVGRVMTLRQLVPSLFLSTLAACGLAAVWWRPAALAGAGIAAAYAAAVLAASAAAAPRHGPRVAAALALVFPVLHVAYGVGFLRGLWDHLLRPRKPVAELSALPLSR